MHGLAKKVCFDVSVVFFPEIQSSTHSVFLVSKESLLTPYERRRMMMEVAEASPPKKSSYRKSSYEHFCRDFAIVDEEVQVSKSNESIGCLFFKILGG